MKRIFNLFLFFILVLPYFGIAQTSDFCGKFSKPQIIDSLKMHPELKYSINYFCFDKLNYKDITTIYGTDNISVLRLIEKYKRHHSNQAIGRIVFISSTVVTFILFGSIGNVGEGASYRNLGFGILLTPIDIIGLTVLALSENSKKKLYNELIIKH